MDLCNWKPVAGYEGWYEVSDTGLIRSVGRSFTRKGGRSFTMKSVVRKLRPGCKNRMEVGLYMRGKTRFFLVYRLVAQAFLGPKPAGLDILHGPGGPHDDSVANLKYGTRKENMADKVMDGTDQRGEKHPMSKLTEAQARRVKFGDEPYHVLVAELGVSQPTISNIRTGRSWRHLHR